MRDLRTPRISPAQMICLLVLSRMFIVLIFIPDANGSSQGSASLLAIVLGFVLTAAAMVPAWLLLKKHPGMDLQILTMQLSPKLGRVSAVVLYLVCLVVSAETAAQFTMFLTSAVYPRASVLWVGLIFCGAVLYLVLLGLEAVTRTAAIMLAATILSSLLISLGLWGSMDTLNLISPLYDGWGKVLYRSTRYFTQNIELIAFVLLLSNLNTPKLQRTFWGYHTMTSVILLAVSYAAITVLGSYGETQNFPVYTLFVLSGSNVFYRFDYVLLVLWVATAMIRAALYLILACRTLGTLGPRLQSRWVVGISAAAVTVTAITAVRNIQLFGGLYHFLADGVPVYFLLLFWPVLLLLLAYNRQKKEERR